MAYINGKKVFQIGGIVVQGGGSGDIDALINGSIAEIESDVTAIKQYAFMNCTLLETADFPNATSIGGGAFQSCVKLEEINAPNAVSILSAAFYGCEKLKAVSLPKFTNASYQGQIFKGCTDLETADLAVCQNISAQMFDGCTALQSIRLGITTQVCNLRNVSGIPASATHHITIYVPSELIESYKVANNWSTLYNNGYITFLPLPLDIGDQGTISNNTLNVGEDAQIQNNTLTLE